MLSKGDDYPIHQRPEPIAYSGSDRNFYDRYFFNGYAREGELFFACALGVYPHLNIMDASFSVIKDGTQHNLRASRYLMMERMNTKVGPLAVEVLEPLESLRIVIDENEHGINADLVFTKRAMAVEEPRYTRRSGPRMAMDSTRMTQNGTYSGWINVKGEKVDVTSDMWLGTRDRSWGIRGVGAQDPQPHAPPVVPQFYWLWAPVNFDDCITLYTLNDDAEGKPWHESGTIAPVGVGPVETMKKTGSEITYKSGTRHAATGAINFLTQNDEEIRIEIEPLYPFYMSGLGYLHPEWGHGLNKGELAVGYDTIDLATADPTDPLHLHIQAVCRFAMGDKIGMGVLEQMFIGAHAPSGFKDIFDMAP